MTQGPGITSKDTCMRLKWDYAKQVKIPETYRQLLWEYPCDKAPLEMVVLRILTYGAFPDLKWLYKKYHNETFKLAFKYPTIKRGVRFWIRRWHDAHAKISA